MKKSTQIFAVAVAALGMVTYLATGTAVGVDFINDVMMACSDCDYGTTLKSLACSDCDYKTIFNQDILV